MSFISFHIFNVRRNQAYLPKKNHHQELRSLQYLDYNKKYVNRIFIKIPGYLKFLFKQQFCEEHQIYNKTFSFLKKPRPTKQEKQNHQH